MRLSRVSAAIKIPDALKPAARFVKGIQQAKAEGGTLPSVRGPLRRLMRDSYIRYGDFVGEDSRGNKYYINHDYPVPRNRWVVFAENTFEQTYDFDASDVPSEWHRWLTYMTDDPPVNNVVKKYDGTVLSEGVVPADRKFITDYQRNMTGTKDQYVPYSTTRKKIESWDPEA